MTTRPRYQRQLAKKMNSAPDNPEPDSPGGDHVTTTDEKIRVDLGPRSYDILIGPGLIDRCGGALAAVMPRPRVVILTDDNVGPLYADRLRTSLDSAGIRHDLIEIAHGESSKDFATLERVTEQILALGIERRDTIIALGGGVVGDLAGFIAAILLRGIDFIQVPTTLLAQVDSSVGGKTAINARQGKNLVGAFHQPRLVVADTDTLDTLPKRELLAGYAETVKYGLICDPPLFDWLESDGAALLAGDAAARTHAIRRACEIKAALVAEDEREAGRRALLNLGHTFGHALEAEAGYGDDLLHGEAVAAGMALAFDLSVQLGLCPAADANRVRKHLADAGLPTRIGDTPIADPGHAADRLIAHMWKDKKVADGQITFILVRRIGEAFATRDVSVEALSSLLSGDVPDGRRQASA